MQFGSQACCEADTRQRTRLVRVQSDAASVIRHRDDELLVGSQAVPLGRLQVHADEQVIEAAPHGSGQVGVLDGIEELRLVYVAAQSVSHAVVPQGAHRAIQLQRVVVELEQVHPLRELQNVNAPGRSQGHWFAFIEGIQENSEQRGFAGSDLFSSGMWRAIMVSGS